MAGRVHCRDIRSAADRVKNIDGLILDDRGSARDALEDLARNHFFTWVHRDGREVAVPRGGGIVVSIPRGDLRVHHFDFQLGDVLQTMVKDSDTTAIPRRGELQWHDRARRYHPNMRASWRDGNQAGMGLANIGQSEAAPPSPYARSTSEVLTGARAQQIIDVEMAQLTDESASFGISLNSEYRYLQPGDSVEIEWENWNERVFLQSAQKEQFGVLGFTVVRESPDIFQAPPGEVTEGLPAVDVETIGDVTIFFIQTNALIDSQVNGAYGTSPAPTVAIYTAHPTSSGHMAVASEYLQDPPSNAGQYMERFRTTSTMGFTTGTFADFAGGSSTWDNTSTLTVDLIRGSLESADAEDIENDPLLNLLHVDQELVGTSKNCPISL